MSGRYASYWNAFFFISKLRRHTFTHLLRRRRGARRSRYLNSVPISQMKIIITRMHSSRMRTVRCSGRLSCHARPPCHAHPVPCMPPLPRMPPAMHAPLPCMPPATQAPCHACSHHAHPLPCMPPPCMPPPAMPPTQHTPRHARPLQ